jgi:excisionase family DNA binding protein
MKRYLSVKEVCERLPVGKSLVYRLVRDGTLPSTRLGGKILVDEDGLVAILEKGLSQKEAPSPERQEELSPHPPVKKRRTGTKGKIDLW